MKRKPRGPLPYRATVRVEGADDQRLYGYVQSNLLVQALTMLTSREPGVGGLYPQDIIMEKRDGQRWIEYRKILYTDVDPDEYVWWQREVARLRT
jgi:hypothetical protein